MLWYRKAYAPRTLDLQEKFDLIFIPFNSIHHLYRNEDLFKALACIKNHLKEKGLFLLDCFNSNIQYIVENEKSQAVIAEYTTDDGREVLIKQTMRYESATQINRIEWHYFINGEFHSTQNLDMRLFFPQELDSYLERTGFNIIHKFGCFKEELFRNESEKQIYVKSCNVRGCSEVKHVDFCFQCEEFPCNKTGFDEHLYNRHININNRMKEVGVEMYYEEIKDLPRY